MPVKPVGRDIRDTKKMKLDYFADKPRAACDTECFPNAWFIGFKDIATRKSAIMMRTEELELDVDRVKAFLLKYKTYTFNGLGYDLMMIHLALTGATCEQLKQANDEIIPGEGLKGLMSWEFYDKYNIKPLPWLDHIDLMPVAPSAAQRASLKQYAGMMHCKVMLEFGQHFNTRLDAEQIQDAKKYLQVDLDHTCDLAEELAPQIDIRSHISKDLGVDVRSKSDAQIGEAIMRARVEKRKGWGPGTGKKLYKPDIKPGPFKYEAPRYIEYQTPMMQGLLSALLRADFVVRWDGYVDLPSMFGAKKKKVIDLGEGIDYSNENDDDDEGYEGGSDFVFGSAVVKMGIGGLHSQEKAQSVFEDDDHLIVDIDVTGYYPNLKLRSGKEPTTMRGHYLAVFKEIVDERAAAKKAGNKPKAEQGKIASNGLFGKNGSPWSIVYAPPMLIQTTVTGQLSLFMLIEEFVMVRGWQVVSVNTDGIVVRIPRKDHGLFKLIIWDWEYQCGLNMEFTYYKSIHSLNVNSYMAFKKKQDKDGNFTGEVEVKRKGKYAPSGRGIPAAFGLKKAPEVEICYDAAVQLMLDGTPIESTIRNCQDIRKFVTVRKVRGGAEKDGTYLGKNIRFYNSAFASGTINYVLTGNKVSKSDGAEPLMVLPDELPDDIDYQWYERKAYDILDKSGLEVIDPTTEGRTGRYFARLNTHKTIHVVDAATGVAICGAKKKDRMDNWIEFKTAPKLCGKCGKLHGK